MTDAPFSPDATPEPAAGQAQEIEVDLAAFLPEGVELEADPVDDDEAEAALEALSDSEPVEVDVPSDAEPVDDSSALGSAEGAPVVDVEALSQIERDLDAVDAAIAALDAGTYGIDPATGEPIDDALLAANPTRLS